MTDPHVTLVWHRPLDYDGEIDRVELAITPQTERCLSDDAPEYVRFLAAKFPGVPLDPWNLDTIVVGLLGSLTVVHHPSGETLRRFTDDWDHRGPFDPTRNRWSAEMEFTSSAPIWMRSTASLAGHTPEQLFGDAFACCASIDGWPEVEVILTGWKDTYARSTE